MSDPKRTNTMLPGDYAERLEKAYPGADDYYLRRDAFMDYIRDYVNPSRRANHLPPLDLHTARECFRLIDEKTWQGSRQYGG
jgi:hypothetical protein